MAIARRYAGERVIWAPNSQPQFDLLRSSVPDVFFGGERGGGKTDALIGDNISHSSLYAQHAKGILFRRTMDELEEVQLRCNKYLGGLGWNCRGQKPTWHAPNGATLKLRFLERDEDALRYQGHEYTWLGVDEAGNFPTSSPIDLLRACLRSPAGVPTFSRLTGNPGGPGHQWLKRRYIDPSPPGVPFRDEDARVYRLFIPSSWRDNRTLLENDPSYIDRLYAATVGKPWLRKNWIQGDWDAVPDVQPFHSPHYHAGREWTGLSLFYVVDMAYTKKKHSDLTAEGIWGADSTWNLFEQSYKEAKMNVSERLDSIFATMRLWQPRGLDMVHIECHNDFIETLHKEQEIRSFHFGVNQLKSEGVSKDDRIIDNVGAAWDRLHFAPGSKLSQRCVEWQIGQDGDDDGPDMLAYLCREADRAAKPKPYEEPRTATQHSKIQKRERLLYGSKARFEVNR